MYKKPLLSFLPIIVICYSVFSQPMISSFSPGSGPVGTSVTITGSSFSSIASDNIVFFGAVRAVVNNASSTSINVIVPAGATFQPVTVTVNALTAWSKHPFIVTFPGGLPIYQNAGPNQNSFETQTEFATGLKPNAVTIADFDGDGKADFATPNNYSTIGELASVSVLRNIGNSGLISFSPKQDIPTGVLTYAIASGDLDGDGKIDLVSSSVVDKTISVFKNVSAPGAITFSAKIDYATGDNPFSIAVSDIDNDGKADLVVANYLSNSFSVFRNISSGGNIAFASRIDFAAGLLPRCVAAGDIDGDGKPDLAVATESGSIVSVFRNISTNGSILFAARADFATGGKTYGVALGDLDADGKVDIATANNNSNNYSVLRNTSSPGAISFAVKVDFPCGASPYSVSINDLNGDSKPEVVIPSFNLSVSQNVCTPGTISFAGGTYLFATPNVNAVGLGDFDGDGKADIMGSGFTVSKVLSFRNKNNEPTISSFLPSTAAPGATVTIYGYDFTGVTAVGFGGIPATSFTVVNTNTITAVVGNGASGAVSVTNQYGTNKLNGFTYAGPPVINSFNPISASPGDTVTINGSNFSGATAVSFGTVSASSFTVVSASQIRAVAGAGASGVVRVTTAYGTDSLTGFIYVPKPVITSFTPGSAKMGDVISITGINFTGTNSVNFGNLPAQSFVVNSGTSISATVGGGASGSVTITNNFGAASLPGFIFYPAPTISSFTPTGGISGNIITVNGTNFSNITGVTVGNGNYTSSYTFVSSTQIKITLGLQGSSGSISITTLGGTASVPGFVFNPQPTVSSVTPTDAGAGMTVNITGTNFNGATSVSFGGTAAASFVVNSPTSITAITGAGASGNIIVTNSFGVNSSSPTFTFTNKPIIYSFTPAAGPVGTLVTITGGNFSTNLSDNIVYFGAVRASVVSATNLKLQVIAPAGASYAYISVTNNSRLTDYSAKPFNVRFEGGGVSITPNDFAGRSDILDGTSPNKVRIADLDNDGKPDVIVSRDRVLSFYRNISTTLNLAFSPRLDFPFNNVVNAFEPGDLDGDGKTDIVVAKGNDSICILKNSTGPGAISFTTATIFSTLGYGYFPSKIAIGNLNKDGKPDIAIAIQGQNTVIICINTSAANTVSFNMFPYVLPESLNEPYHSRSISMTDFNNDGLQDVVIGTDARHFFIFNNQSVSNNYLFSLVTKSNGFTHINNEMINADFNQDGKPDLISNQQIFRGLGNYNFFNVLTPIVRGETRASDIDGDGMPDYVNIASNRISLTSPVFISRNISSAAALAFEPPVSFADGNLPSDLEVGDLNMDGKPDIVFTNSQGNTFTVLTNKVGAANLCPGGNTILPSTLTGASFQWEVNTGSGFANITNDTYYNGANMVHLQLTNIPLSWNGYQYRCLVDGVHSNVYTLSFSNTNTWVGGVDQTWENANNWSCGCLPGDSTNVIINSGTVIVNSNTVINSLTLNNDASFTVNPGVVFTILH